MRMFLSRLATFGASMLVALAIPIAILVVGTPIVLIVRLVVDIAGAL